MKQSGRSLTGRYKKDAIEVKGASRSQWSAVSADLLLGEETWAPPHRGQEIYPEECYRKNK